MPELPEVETVLRILGPQLRGKRIEKTQVLLPKIVAHPEAEAFVRGTEGRRILEMERRGKFLRLFLEGGGELVLHLRMTGELLRTPADFPRDRHTHLVFSLEDGSELRYADLRRFGRFWLLENGEADGVTGMADLGPEPFSPEVTGEYLALRLGGTRRAVKTCLLDQTLVAGIGNIYADESLFAAGIAPERAACSLGAEEFAALAEAMRSVLTAAIEANAMTPEEYLAGQGRAYRVASVLKVYGREGKPCPKCGRPLAMKRLNGRNSRFCPECQK